MARYVLSSAVLTDPGTFEYRLLSPSGAKRWLAAGVDASGIRWKATADALTIALGVSLPVNKRYIHLQPGDEALIFRLRVPVSSSKIERQLTPDFIARNAEIGLLRRIA